MVLSLKLELKSNYYVLVTNSETKEQIEVTLNFIQKITKDSLSMLCQYKHYELIFGTEGHWNKLKKFKPELETEIIKEIELKEKEIRNNIRSNIRQKVREKTIAKQQHWNEIAAYNKVQKQWTNDGYKVILESKKSYNKALIALEYADYCLKHDYRYNSKEEDKKNVIPQVALKDGSKEEQNDDKVLSMRMKEQEQKIIALEKENQALRERITELETEYRNFDFVEIIS